MSMPGVPEFTAPKPKPSDWIVPALADCNPGILPVEFCVLVAMAEKPETTKGGIIMPSATKDREEWASDHARMVAVSPLSFNYADMPSGRHPAVGDVVFVGKYAGDQITGKDGRKYKLVQDRAVLAIIEESGETA